MSADTLSTTAGPCSATSAQQTAAKIIGIIYPLQMATGIFGEVFVRSQPIVRGDAAKTAENIMASQKLFRLSIAGDLITYIPAMVLTWPFYVLLRPVNRHLALLGAFFRLSEVSILCVATVNSPVILRLLSGAAYLKSFEVTQLHSLVMLAHTTQGLAMSIGFTLLGLGLAAFAYLLLRSHHVPQALATMGIFSSLLLATGSLAIIVFPGLGAIGMCYMIPLGLYEVGPGFWLLIKGIKTPAAQQP